MAITRAQQARQMLKDGKVAMQGGGRNYLGKQKTVSNVPIKWQSGPDTPPTELAYITGIKRISTSEFEEDEEIPPQVIVDENNKPIKRKEQPLYFKENESIKAGAQKIEDALKKVDEVASNHE